MDYSDQYDFVLIGLSCVEREHRLAWAINKTMGWNLAREKDLEVVMKSGLSSHARFSFRHPEDQTVFTLLANRSDSSVLLPEWGQFDYLLKIQEDSHESEEVIFGKIRRVPFVLAALELPSEKVRSIQNLISS